MTGDGLRRAEQPADNDDALRQWNSAAPGWAKWEPVINRMMAAPTEVMLDRAGVGAGSRVVDIACGAGDQALAAARRAGPSGFILATDISSAMLEFVAAKARAEGLRTIATHACAADDMPRDQALFDAAICRLGLMLLPNPGAAVAAVRDVLRPGGCFGAVVFGPPAANPFNVELVGILRRHAGKPAPASGPGFFALAEPAVLTALFEDAGLTEVSITTLDTSHSLPSADEALRMVREAFGGVWGIIADQPQAVQDAAWADVRLAFRRFETADGFVAPTRFHVVGGRKPE